MKTVLTAFPSALLRILLLTLMVVTHNATASDQSDTPTEKIILGWIENVYLQPQDLKAKAKLDTGAKTSSIHAKNIEHFEKEGDQWVRFQFASNTKLSDKKYAEGKSKKVITIEAPLSRRVLIKHHKRSSVQRPVVVLPFTLAGVQYEAEFTLTDRSKFLYPVLLGRRFLKDVAIVDPANTFLRTRTQPKAEPAPAAEAPVSDPVSDTPESTDNNNDNAQ